MTTRRIQAQNNKNKRRSCRNCSNMGGEETHMPLTTKESKEEKREVKKKIFCLCFRNFLVQQMTEITVYWKRLSQEVIQ